MKNKLFLVSQIVICFILIGCGSPPPPKEFLDLKVGVYYADLGTALSIQENVNLSEFISSIPKPGKWEKVDNIQYIYRIKGEDAITKKKEETALLFMKHTENNAVILRRVAFNGEDIPSGAKDQLFNNIALPLALKKASNKQQEQQAQRSSQTTNKSTDQSPASNDVQRLKEEFASADKEINLVYKDLMKKLSPGVKSELKNEQIAWIKEKENKCNAETSDVNRLNCLIKMTTERTSQLKIYSSK